MSDEGQAGHEDAVRIANECVGGHVWEGERTECTWRHGKMEQGARREIVTATRWPGLIGSAGCAVLSCGGFIKACTSVFLLDMHMPSCVEWLAYTSPLTDGAWRLRPCGSKSYRKMCLLLRVCVYAVRTRALLHP